MLSTKPVYELFLAGGRYKGALPVEVLFGGSTFWSLPLASGGTGAIGIGLRLMKGWM